MRVEKELDNFGKYIVQQTRSRLTKADKNNKKNLYNSISYEKEVHKNSFSLSISMEDYGKFVDKGVKGVSSSAKAPNSPYKFGTGTEGDGGLTNGVLDWVKSKRIQFQSLKKYNKNATGKFYTYEQTAFLIRNSIWHKGLKTTDFFTKTFDLAFKRLPDDLIAAYSLDVDNLLKLAVND